MTTTAALCSSGFDAFHHSAILGDQKITRDSSMSHSATTEWPCVTWPLEVATQGWDPHFIKAGVVSNKRIKSPSQPGEGQMQTDPSAALEHPWLFLGPWVVLHPCPTTSSCPWQGSSPTGTANVALCPWFYIPK